jgi:hypothetical protein
VCLDISFKSGSGIFCPGRTRIQIGIIVPDLDPDLTLA